MSTAIIRCWSRCSSRNVRHPSRAATSLTTGEASLGQVAGESTPRGHPSRCRRDRGSERSRMSHRGCSLPVGPPSSAGPRSRPGVGPHRRRSARLSGTRSHGVHRRRTCDCRPIGCDHLPGPGTGLLGTRPDDRRADEKADADAEHEPRRDTDAYPTGCVYGAPPSALRRQCSTSAFSLELGQLVILRGSPRRSSTLVQPSFARHRWRSNWSGWRSGWEKRRNVSTHC